MIKIQVDNCVFRFVGQEQVTNKIKIMLHDKKKESLMTNKFLMG